MTNDNCEQPVDSRQIMHSHGSTSLCCKRYDANHQKIPKFDPSPGQNPANNLHRNWHAWMCHKQHRMLKILSKLVQGFPLPRHV